MAIGLGYYTAFVKGFGLLAKDEWEHPVACRVGDRLPFVGSRNCSI